VVVTPPLRKLALTLHITASVGWMGADGVFLALALIGLNSADPPSVQAAYLAMQMAAWYVIVPLSLASLVTGLIQGLGTKWGLFNHYWIVIKLIINVFANVALLIHTQPIGRLAAATADRALASGELHAARLQLVVAAGGGLALLLVATTVAVFKPRGLTPYGWRAQRARRQAH
jgi:hypothetical protein